jgi:MOSC domain-containing protein YiiM
MPSGQGRILALAVRSAARARPEERPRLQLAPSSGIEGDHGAGARRQLTILGESQWQTVCHELGRDLPWTIRRANMLVSGIEFGPEWSGKRLRIGAVVLLVHGEVTPCHRMEEQVTGLHDLLLPEWRGGIFCEVLDAGEIKIGDSLEILDGS